MRKKFGDIVAAVGLSATAALTAGCRTETIGSMTIYDQRTLTSNKAVSVTVYREPFGTPYYLYDGRRVYLDESPESETEPRNPPKPSW